MGINAAVHMETMDVFQIAEEEDRERVAYFGATLNIIADALNEVMS